MIVFHVSGRVNRATADRQEKIRVEGSGNRGNLKQVIVLRVRIQEHLKRSECQPAAILVNAAKTERAQDF
jgi:hypothetical protein